MTTLLCSSPCCALPGQHLTEPADGHDDTCRGCQPARAADGLYLCQRCTAGIGRDALNAARLHAALGQALAGGPGRHGPGSDTVGLNPDDVAIEARTAIRATLVALCRLVAEERGIGLPDDGVLDLARYVCRHAVWLAAHPAAGEHAQDLRDVAGDRRSWSVAYPVSGDRTLIGVCNQARTALSGDPGAESEAVAACGTPLWHRDGDADLTCPACGTAGTVQWWRWEMCSAAERDGVVDAYAAAAYLSWRWDRAVDPGLVRKWGTRHRLTLRSLVRDDQGAVADGPLLRDHLGRVLFVLAELEGHATRVWGEATATLAVAGLMGG